MTLRIRLTRAMKDVHCLTLMFIVSLLRAVTNLLIHQTEYSNVSLISNFKNPCHITKNKSYPPYLYIALLLRKTDRARKDTAKLYCYKARLSD